MAKKDYQIGIDLVGNDAQLRKTMNNSLRAVNGWSRAVSNSVRRVAASISLLPAAGLAGFGASLAYLTKQVMQTGMKMDGMRNRLVAISGSVEMADTAMQSMFNMTNQLGVNFMATTDTFSRFTIAAKEVGMASGTANKVFESVTMSAAAMGLTTENTRLTLKALEQMLSKGTVQAEELRGQLGEHLPGAFGMAAKAMGITTRELMKMMEKGELMATDLLPKLADVLDKKFRPIAERAAKMPRAALNRLINAWDELKDRIYRSGVGEEISRVMDTIAEKLRNFDVKEFATKVIDVFLLIIRNVKGVIAGIKGIGEALANIPGLELPDPYGDQLKVLERNNKQAIANVDALSQSYKQTFMRVENFKKRIQESNGSLKESSPEYQQMVKNLESLGQKLLAAQAAAKSSAGELANFKEITLSASTADPLGDLEKKLIAFRNNLTSQQNTAGSQLPVLYDIESVEDLSKYFDLLEKLRGDYATNEEKALKERDAALKALWELNAMGLLDGQEEFYKLSNLIHEKYNQIFLKDEKAKNKKLAAESKAYQDMMQSHMESLSALRDSFLNEEQRVAKDRDDALDAIFSAYGAGAIKSFEEFKALEAQINAKYNREMLQIEEDRLKGLNSLRADMMTESEKIVVQKNQRLSELEDSWRRGDLKSEEEYFELRKRIYASYSNEMAQIGADRNSALASLRDTFRTETEQAEYLRTERMKTINDAWRRGEIVSTQDYLNLKRSIEESYNDSVIAAEKEKQEKLNKIKQASQGFAAGFAQGMGVEPLFNNTWEQLSDDMELWAEYYKGKEDLAEAHNAKMQMINQALGDMLAQSIQSVMSSMTTIARNNLSSAQAAYNERYKQLEQETAGMSQSAKEAKIAEDVKLKALKDRVNSADAQNRKMFDMNKRLQIAMTITNTASAIMKAFNELPVFAAPAAAAMIAATGAAQLAAIRSASYSGGGGSVSGVTGTSSASDSRVPEFNPQAQETSVDISRQTVVINLSAIDTQTGTDFLLNNASVITSAVSSQLAESGRAL